MDMLHLVFRFGGWETLVNEGIVGNAVLGDSHHRIVLRHLVVLCVASSPTGAMEWSVLLESDRLNEEVSLWRSWCFKMWGLAMQGIEIHYPEVLDGCADSESNVVSLFGAHIALEMNLQSMCCGVKVTSRTRAVIGAAFCQHVGWMSTVRLHAL